jgi:FkbM family methyltransferase
MPVPIKIRRYDGLEVRYRPGTSDERVLREVIETRAYRRASAGFDVEAGEHWLDLGANIGAFAVYCKLRGATAECYEPDPGSFSLLTRNAAGFRCVLAAVTHRRDKYVIMWSSTRPGNHYRGTVIDEPEGALREYGRVANLYAGSLAGPFDGIKMDIEGSELALLDGDLLPPCRKLAFEYHTSRDQDCGRLGRRLAALRERFRVVAYVPEIDRLVARGGRGKTFHDRVIYCMK